MSRTANSIATHVLLLGCGLWGRNILRDLIQLGCRVTVVDPDPRARAALSETPDLSVLPTDSGVQPPDGVIVATPASTHRDVVLQTLRWNVPVFCEKPLTTSVADAQALVQAGADRLFVMHIWRYHPGILALAELASSGELGPVTGLRTTRTNWTSPRTDVDPLWTLVPHDLSIALAILGEIPTPRAAAVDLVNGAPVGMIATLGEEPWFVLEASTRHREKRREVRLHCRDGVAVLPHGESTALEVLRSNPKTGTLEVAQRNFDPEPALHRELRCFVEHLRGGPAPPTSVHEGLQVVQAMAALRNLAGLQ